VRFSFIELLIAVAILGIILSIAIPACNYEKAYAPDGDPVNSSDLEKEISGSSDSKWRDFSGSVRSYEGSSRYAIITVDGHDYIVFQSSSKYEAGVSVMHSESCRGSH